MTSSPVLKPHIDPDADGTFDSHYYPHATIDAALGLKADQTALDGVAAAKADQAALDTTNATVATKADLAAVTALTPALTGGLVTGYAGHAPIELPRAHINVLHPEVGAKGDGATDDIAALMLAFAAGSAAKLPVLLPPATYAIGARPSGQTGNLDLPGNLTIHGYGATLKLTEISADTGYRPLLNIMGVSNVAIYGLTIDGNKDANPNTLEAHHGVGIAHAASHIVLTDIEAHHCRGDGLYIGFNIPTCPTNVSVANYYSHHNHRQGISISAGKHLSFVGCRFTDTAGTNPQAGLDIEPNADTDPLFDVTFLACSFLRNAGAAVSISQRDTPTVPQRAARFIGCHLSAETDTPTSGQYGVILRNARDAQFIACGVTQTYYGYYFYQGTNEDVRLIGGTVRDNYFDGVISASGSQTTRRLMLSGVRFANNGLGSLGAKYDVTLNLVSSAVVHACLFGPDDPTAAWTTRAGIAFWPTTTNAIATGNINTATTGTLIADTTDPATPAVLRDNLGFRNRQRVVKVTAQTIANTTGVTKYHTATVNASTMRAGDQIRVQASGTLSTIATSGTLTFLVQVQNVTVLTLTMPSQTTALTGQAWTLDATITVLTAGIAGTMTASGRLSFGGVDVFATTVSQAINTTTNRAIDLWAQWQTANAGNTVTVATATIEQVPQG